MTANTRPRTRSLRSAANGWNQHWPQDSRVFAPYQDLTISLMDYESWPLCEDLNRWASALEGVEMPVSFVPPSETKLADDQLAPYDQVITEKRCVRTRERHWHDLMNALLWAAFPKAKWALHERQHHEVQRMRTNGESNRSPMHDTLAMLDEGGVLAIVDERLAGAIADELRQQNRSTLERELLSQRAHLFVFGHGILESIALRSALQPVYAFACLLPVKLTDTCQSSSESVRISADILLATALNERRVPDSTKPRPSLLLDENWLQKLQAEQTFAESFHASPESEP